MYEILKRDKTMFKVFSNEYNIYIDITVNIMQNEPFLCPIPLSNINLPSQTNIPLQDSFLTKSLYSMLAVHVRTRNSKKVLPPL